jgi:RimJ/RimL family protein N-acetyltransferase
VKIPLGEYEIREYRPEDESSLAAAANNPRVAAQLRDRFPSPYTEADARAWIAAAAARRPVTSFAIATTERVVGGIGLELLTDVHRFDAELGYWIAEELWGRGLATRAVGAFVERAFDAFELVRIHASVFETNLASARVLEKCGFRFEGRLRASVYKGGKLLDQLLYARLAPGH